MRWVQPVPDALIAPESGDPAAVVAAREGVRLALVASLQHLPARQRAVLVLREVLALPATEVAEILQISTASVKSALQRARATLREQAPAEDRISEPKAPQARAVLERYIKAFENADADALQQLLVQDAAIEAPPMRAWFQGVQKCVAGPAGPRHGRAGAVAHVSRHRRRERLSGGCGIPARRERLYRPYGVVVLDVVGDRIARITSFGDPALLPVFGFENAPIGADVAFYGFARVLMASQGAQFGGGCAGLRWRPAVVGVHDRARVRVTAHALGLAGGGRV